MAADLDGSTGWDTQLDVGMLMFYALHELMGPDGCDRAYREFFQRYRTSGATTADLVEVFRRAAGDSLRRLVDGYRQP